MKRRVEILQEAEIFKKAIFRLKEAKLKHERHDGSMSDTITRLSLERGDAVAIVAHNPVRKTVLLIEQFRYPAYKPNERDGWLLEVPAGMIDPHEDSKEAIRREVEEEIGYQVDRVQHIATFFLSPGGSSERIILYYARIDADDKRAAGGGLAEEGEDIRTIEMPIVEAIRKIATGEIQDAKTIIGIQWMQIRGLAKLDSDDDDDD